MATFAWEKAVGDPDELAWWSRTVTEAASRCGCDRAQGTRALSLSKDLT